MFLKKLIPTTLFSRFLLIIVVPTVIVQIVAVYVFYYTHIDRISKDMARSLLSEMSFLKDSLKKQHNNPELVNLFAENINIQFSFDKKEKLTKPMQLSGRLHHRQSLRNEQNHYRTLFRNDVLN